jgi:hypothetical protein
MFDIIFINPKSFQKVYEIRNELLYKFVHVSTDRSSGISDFW